MWGVRMRGVVPFASSPSHLHMSLPPFDSCSGSTGSGGDNLEKIRAGVVDEK